MLEDKLWWLIVKAIISFLGLDLIGFFIYGIIWLGLEAGPWPWQIILIFIALCILFILLSIQLVLSCIKIYRKLEV